jgi:hypothetical protein
MYAIAVLASGMVGEPVSPGIWVSKATRHRAVVHATSEQDSTVAP